MVFSFLTIIFPQLRHFQPSKFKKWSKNDWTTISPLHFEHFIRISFFADSVLEGELLCQLLTNFIFLQLNNGSITPKKEGFLCLKDAFVLRFEMQRWRHFF